MNPPARILVIATRRIGDVLLVTPLIRSLKNAWPDSRIDALVFEGTEGILSGNPDLDGVLAIPPRPKRFAHLRFLLSLWRKYDLSVSTLPGDRPTLYAFFSGKKRFGILIDEKDHFWKKRLLSGWIPFDERIHAVESCLGLAKLLGIEPIYEVVTPRADDEKAKAPYAVLHVYPMYKYKMWNGKAWSELAEWLRKNGFRIVLTGGKDAAEQAYIKSLSFPEDTLDLSGKLTLGGVAQLLSHAGIYVGPDTAVTHMAAAIGIPTLALFGPSNPVKWGPWPRGFRKNPHEMKGSRHAGNVYLLQGKGDCVPCLEEGCERHVASESACLQNLPASDAIEALKRLLGK